MKKIIISLLIALAATAAVRAEFVLTPERKLALAEQIIAGYYVDSVDTTRIVEDAIRAMLKDLDPHSTYSDADETRELTEPLAGNFSGIGIRFQMVRDTVYVIESIPGGPSEKVGIIPGDKIISCNDTVISGTKKVNSDILKVLRGPKGSLARLSVVRGSSSQPLTFDVRRDDIPIYSVDAHYMVNDSVGYISAARFAASTAEEAAKAMKELRSKGMRHLMLDLSDNGGGYLKSAIDLAGMFLKKGDMVVYTESSKGGNADYRLPSDGNFLDGRLVVLVNQYSASASEILSGAIQDNDRGVIVGRRTFGKGLVQRPFPFPDGSMIRLTVSRYFTPAGRCIQKPYTSGDGDEYSLDMLHRLQSGEFMSADSVQFADSLLRHTLHLKRPVYGGGGIMPDRFVPLDTTLFSTYYRDLMAKGIISLWTVDYVDANRKKLLKTYPTEDAFVKGFEMSEALLSQMVEKATAEGVKFDEEGYRQSLPLISAIAKGLIGRDLYEQSTYRRIINPFNDTFTSALEIINSPTLYKSYLTAPKK